MLLLALLACGNQPPTAPTVAIDPGAPTTTDDLAVLVLSEASDPNRRDTVSYRYHWFVDGSARADLTGPTVPAAETAKGQTWRVVVTPNDGESDGPVGEAEATVRNTPPAGSGLTVSNPAPTTLEDVVALAVGTDADGDAVTWTYAWTRDGGSVDGATLPAAETTRDQVWTVSATPSDGEEPGVPLSATLTVADSPPVIDAITFTPSPFFTDGQLEALVEASDADDDPLTLSYAWEVDGAPVGTDAAVLDGADFAKGDAVRVTVTASDGTLETTLRSSAVFVGDSAPTAPLVVIAPAAPEHRETLVCVAETPSTDVDGDAVTYAIAWTRDGSPYTLTQTTTHTGDTIGGETPKVGETWGCAMTPSAGGVKGPPGEASAVISPVDATLDEVQSGDIAAGTVVEVTGVVTGATRYGVWLQDGDAAGLWIFLGDHGPATLWYATYPRETELYVQGRVREYWMGDWGGDPTSTLSTLTELDLGNGGEHEATGTAAEPAPITLSVSDFADLAKLEPYEGMLVRIEGVIVTNAALPGSEWEVTGPVTIDNQMYNKSEYQADFGAQPKDGDAFDAITGVLNFDFGRFKIAPRDAADIDRK